MFQNVLDQQPLIDEVDDLHLAAAFGAFQRVDFPDLFDALTPGLRRDFLCFGSNIFRTSIAPVSPSAVASPKSG